jgi:biotin transport system substrate-specific component
MLFVIFNVRRVSMSISSTHSTPNVEVSSGFLSNILAISAGVGILTLFSKVQIPLPFTPVPLTLAPLAPLVIGVSFGKYRSCISGLLYIALSLIGFPVLAGPDKGLEVLFLPSFGYLFGYLIASWTTGYLFEILKPKTWKKSLLINSLGMFSIWASGLLYLSFHIPSSQLLFQGLLPFALLDAVKVFAASGVTLYLAKKKFG